MIPKIDTTVYVIYEEAITQTTVAFVGKESFITAEFDTDIENDAVRYNYDDYGKTWCLTLDVAKKALLQDTDSDNLVVEKIYDNYWETRTKESKND